MKNTKKQIIISEIKYWKQHKLLPAHFCDFLITLYSGGEESEQGNGKQEIAVLHQEKKKRNRFHGSLFVLVLGIIGSLFIEIESIPWGWPLGLATLCLILLITFTVRQTIKRKVGYTFLYIMCAFLLLGLSFKLWLLLFSSSGLLLIGILLINCSLWIVTGTILKLYYFTISGVFGMLLIAGFIFFQL